MAEVLTISESVKRARADGLPVTEYSLRAWVKAGAVPVRHIGRKALIYYPNLRDFLTCASGGDIDPKTPCPDTSGGIRRLEPRVW